MSGQRFPTVCDLVSLMPTRSDLQGNTHQWRRQRARVQQWDFGSRHVTVIPSEILNAAHMQCDTPTVDRPTHWKSLPVELRVVTVKACGAGPENAIRFGDNTARCVQSNPSSNRSDDQAPIGADNDLTCGLGGTARGYPESGVCTNSGNCNDTWSPVMFEPLAMTGDT